MNEHPVEIEAEDVGQRLDVVLARRVPGVSRRRAQYLVGAGIARIGGAAATKGTRVGEGDVITLTEPVGADFVPEAHALEGVETVCVDEHARVLLKPRGLAAFAERPPATGEPAEPTVAGHLLALDADAADIGFERRRAGLVNVLEPGVSGLLVAGRSPRVFDVIRTYLFEQRAEARLTFLATGSPAADTAGLRVVRREGDVLELELALASGAQRWPLRLTRPLIPQLRAWLAPLGLALAGDDDDPSTWAAVHLRRLAVTHRHFAFDAEAPLPADWPLGE